MTESDDLDSFFTEAKKKISEKEDKIWLAHETVKVTPAIALSPGDDIQEVVAYEPFACPGLVVHRSITFDNEWCISHKTSGYLVNNATWPTRRAALWVCIQLATLADWTVDKDDLVGTLSER